MGSISERLGRSRPRSSSISALLSRRTVASTAPLTLSFQDAASAGAEDIWDGLPSSPTSSSAERELGSSAGRRTQLDVRLLDYVSSCDSNLVCPICHGPLHKPVRLLCDHIFCKDCLQQSFDNRRSSERTCPTCRGRVDSKRKIRSIPRILKQMLDELVVKCPYHGLGCTAEVKRGEVQDHVDLYCDYTMVACPAENCQQTVTLKDLHKGCQHYTVSCSACHVSLMQKDLAQHEQNGCPQRMMSCPGCETELLRQDFPAHLEESCPLAPASCAGKPYGCTFSSTRTEVDDHSKTCPIAAMAPFLASQKAQQDEQAAAQQLLHRKVEILEGGFAAMHALLYNDNPSPSPSLSPTPNSPFDAPGLPSTAHLPNPTSTAPPDLPFDTPTAHLLSLHESLRAELSRLETALAELDARTTMEVTNQGLRAKQEMAHTNAAIGAMRVQLHWLTSARLQQTQRARGPAEAGPSGGGGAGGRAGEGGVGGGGGGGVLLPVRRVSDGSRQETKL